MLLIATACGTTAALTLSACGGGDSSSTETLEGQGGKPPLPPDAPLTQQLNRAFPSPKPTAGAPPNAKAYIKAGQRACKGKTPTEVINEFQPQTKANDFDKGQEQLIEEIGKYEKSPTADFAAGQIAAGVYEATLPMIQQRSGYQGCVYGLAQQLENRLKAK